MQPGEGSVRRLRVVGVDPGSSVTGFGVVELLDGRLRHIASGRIAAGLDGPLPRRLQVIHESLGGLLHEVRADAVAVESLFYSRNVRSALVLAHSRGVVLLAAAEAGLPVTEYSPMEVKRATVGYGRAGKEQVQAMVARLLALPDLPAADAADALGVAICHVHQVGLGAAVFAAGLVPEGAPTGHRYTHRPQGSEGRWVPGSGAKPPRVSDRLRERGRASPDRVSGGVRGARLGEPPDAPAPEAPRGWKRGRRPAGESEGPPPASGGGGPGQSPGGGRDRRPTPRRSRGGADAGRRGIE